MAENSNRSVEVGGDAHGAIIVTGDANVVQILREKPRDITKSPYKFLSYYDIGDRDIFFGRDTVIDELAGLVSRHKVVIINGQSGSGKTSLINAGLIPRLADNGYLFIAFRDYSDPLQQLREYLNDSPHFAISDVDQMSLLQIMRAIRDRQSKVVVIFDQFERFFVGIREPEKRRTFLKELKQCLDSELTADQLNLVLSLREDFLGKLMSETAKMIPELLQEGPPYPLLPLGRDEARQAIVGPLTLVDHKIDYDDRFVDEVLLPDLSREATGDSQIEPPHLQIVCNKLYEEACGRHAEKLKARRLVVIERGLYEELGEAKGMLRDYLDDVVKQVSDGNEDAVHSMLKLMIETVGTRKFVSADAIRDGLADVAEDETTILLKKLHEARVVETRGSGNDLAYSLSHEVMVDKVREWHDPREIRIKRAEETLERGRRQWQDNQKTVLDEEQVSLVKDCLSETLTDSDRELIARSEQRHRTLRFIKRTAIVAVVVCLILLPIAIWKSVQASINATDANQAKIAAQEKEKEANEERLNAEAATIKAQRNLAQTHIERGRNEVQRGNYAQGVSYFFAAYDSGQTEQHEPFSSSARNLIAGWSTYLGTPLLHDGRVFAVAFSRDGKTILTASEDHTARLWDAETGAARGEPMKHEGLLAISVSPDGKTVLTGGKDQTARLWDAETGAARGEPMKHEDSVLVVAFSPDGKSVLTGSGSVIVFISSAEARLWDVKTGAPRSDPMKHKGSVSAVAFSFDGKIVLTGSDDGTARLWDAETGASRGDPMNHKGPVKAVAFSRDGKTVLTGGVDRTARLWDAETGAPQGEPMKHEGSIYAVALSPDGKTVLTGSEDGTAQLWHAETGAPRGEPMKHGDSVYAVAFGPDGKTVLTGSKAITARRWDAETGAPRGEPMNHEGPVLAVAFSPNGNTVLTGSGNTSRRSPLGVARLWDAETGVPLVGPIRHADAVNAVAFSPDGRSVLTGSGDGIVRFWNAETGVPLVGPIRHADYVDAVAYSPDGKSVLTGSWHTARLWDAETGAPRGDPMKHESSVLAVAFSPNGKTVLTGSLSPAPEILRGEARLWDAKTGAPRGDPMEHKGSVSAVAFSPDGKTVLTGSEDHTARLWNAETGAPRGDPMNHEDMIRAVAFSPDGKTVLTGGTDNNVRLWDAQTGAVRGEPVRHAGWVNAAAFSPDGKTVITGSEDKTAHLWDVTLPALDDHERLRLSVEVRTGLFFNEQGRLQKLTHADWFKRKQQLKALGGPCDIVR